MRQQWEYHIIHFDWNTWWGDQNDSSGALKKLNEAGREGWEVVSVSGGDEEAEVMMILLKRPLGA